MIKYGLIKSEYEPCVFIKRTKIGLIIVGLYVDDIFLLSSDEVTKETIKRELMGEFEMTDLGQLKYFLGVNCCIGEDNTLTLDQTHYISEILSKFCMVDCKPVATPLEKGKNAETEGAGEPLSSEVPYQSLIGHLMYLAVVTRPDIAFAVSHLSQFNKAPTRQNWSDAKRVVRYLKGTLNLKLKFSNSEHEILGYVDADWASCTLDRRSYTGYVFKMSNAPISWESRKQRTVALSSAEAEYMALGECSKEGTFLYNLYEELVGDKAKIKIFSDNQSAKKIAENPVFHSRTKHIHARYHFVRQTVKHGIVDLKYLPTEEMPADFLTKVVPRAKHEYCTKIFLKE